MQPEKNRISQIDALRGFALLGILVVNIFVFHAPYAHYSTFYTKFTGWEADVLENMIFFCAGQFMPIFAFLFSGYGLGLYAKLLPSQLILIALLIYGVQCVFSFIWLKKHPYGPLEALWRKWSYAQQNLSTNNN